MERRRDLIRHRSSPDSSTTSGMPRSFKASAVASPGPPFTALGRSGFVPGLAPSPGADLDSARPVDVSSEGCRLAPTSLVPRSAVTRRPSCRTVAFPARRRRQGVRSARRIERATLGASRRSVRDAPRCLRPDAPAVRTATHWMGTPGDAGRRRETTCAVETSAATSRWSTSARTAAARSERAASRRRRARTLRSRAPTAVPGPATCPADREPPRGSR